MKHCIACGKLLPEQSLFELTSAPASAQDIPDAKEVQQDEGVTLHLRQCGGCGLVQFDCEPVSYYRDVIRAGGGSSTMRELRTSQYRHLIETYHLEGKTFFEAGCGRGEFLKFLQEFPVEIYGMEHKADLVETAQAEGLHVWREFPEREDQRFGHSPEASMLQESGWSVPEKPFDVFLSFNFLEHQPRPDVMLKAIWNNLAEDGMGLVTVPSLEYILEKESYYELIRDHIAYYTFDTLRALLNHCGFEVLEEEMINRDTLSMVVRKTAMPETDADVSAAGSVQSGTPSGATIIAPLTEGYKIVTGEVRALTDRLVREGKRLAMWGASHQGFTLASTSELGEHLAYIIDSAPFKQGRFAPASHVPIVAPDHYFEDPVDAVLIVAPGYTDEIAGIIKTKFGEKVETMTLRTNRIEHL
ncbi:class I SAM-dependent methyltransferase [Ventrimonas sp. CLA-AP-H27]|uniref:Class I SAM-dependent methyltransferase n=1 Tax=Ventrimonas faecis TaxID=3133170 RepID=A0ABV1HND1_9FIRM